MKFIHFEDKQYFADVLCKGNMKKLDAEYSDYFDFRQPSVKRREFNLKRKKIFDELSTKYGCQCMLRLHQDCTESKHLAVDHLIPLSSNELNKRLRKLKPLPGKKILTQSYGSNNIKNLILACNRCNNFKKHRMLNQEDWKRIMAIKYA